MQGLSAFCSLASSTEIGQLHGHRHLLARGPVPGVPQKVNSFSSPEKFLSIPSLIPCQTLSFLTVLPSNHVIEEKTNSRPRMSYSVSSSKGNSSETTAHSHYTQPSRLDCWRLSHQGQEEWRNSHACWKKIKENDFNLNVSHLRQYL